MIYDDLVLGLLKVFFNSVHLSCRIAFANVGAFWVLRALSVIFGGDLFEDHVHAFGTPVSRTYLDVYPSSAALICT